MDEYSKFDRRTFFKYSTALAVTGALQGIPFISEARAVKQHKITVLHTNDWHSRIEPFPADDKNYAGKGGAEARAALVSKIRTEEEHVLLLDAGDIFQGTPYFNFYNGELEYKLMTHMGYDCATLGNHDFDNGIEGILKQLPYAGFEFVNCNYDFSGTMLDGIVKPYKIIRKGEITIGILGVGIELKGLVPDKLCENVRYQDPVEHANRVAAKLKQELDCDLVICLSHLGYKYGNDKISDQVLAARSENIDLIIGGHTHTFLSKPEAYQNAVGKQVLVNQVGWAGINMGRIDFYFEKGKHKTVSVKQESFLHSI